MSSLYLFGRKQDIGFEIPIKGARGHRHHVRFWATTYDPGKLTVDKIHWLPREEVTPGRNVLWIGAASRDVGLAVIRHNGQMTHMIDPDTNAERQFIIDCLQAKHLIMRTTTIRLGSPYRLTNRAFRGRLHSDGVLQVVTLKRPAGKR